MKSPILLFALVLPVGALGAQTTNPPYLSEMPPVERVLRETKGPTADETAARQMGAFLQIKDIIQKMASYRFYRNQLTADEKRVIQVYYTAYWEIAKTKPEYQKFTGLKGFDIDPDYRQELFDKFFSSSFRAQYEAIDATFKRNVAARAKEDTANMMRVRAEVAEYQKEQAGKGKSVRALARCVAAGRSETQCLSEGLVGDFKQMFGRVLPGGSKEPTGLRLSGVFKNSRGLDLTFWDVHAVVACGQLVADERAYSVELRDNLVAISLRTSPELLELLDGPSRPVVLTLGPNGRLTGPGPVDITGRVIVGYREFTRHYSDGRVVPMKEAIYERRTVRCSFDAFALSGPAPAIGKASEVLTVGLDVAFGAGESAPLKPVPTGLRLAGEYGTQSAFDLEFNPRGVVVGCGEAVVARDYSVQVQGAQVAVRVQHGATPLTLTLRPDGTLAGSGTVEVSGRVIAGTTPSGDLAYAPLTTTCPVGVLAVSGAEPAAAPAGGGAAGPSGVSGAGNPGGAGATAVLSLASGFPTAAASPNPLGGRTFFLLRRSVETILTAAGVRASAGASVVLAWQAACQKQAPECQKALQALLLNNMALVKTDVTGKAQFPSVPPGTYYLFGAGSANGRELLWNLRVELKAGANAVTLDQRNALPGN